ncbi:DUF3618 domain-containing protein [Aldersonia sp. NBC_00410]|uniref:DUF3618 domain-containing protein n=1 Tax=Aldersonia sp. NBC_00410 TaxID=2975954 RepID=UPI002257BBE9|nr:DUF3618 domain-containing protein [Aldersonia sp. NBC_00410]MCX5044133.1 DUF3618 domain-containing protein [Aldersonia sp. NBC_00410]
MTDHTPDIEEQRAEIAATVEALAAKADVPTRLRSATEVQRRKLQDNAPLVAAAVGGVVAAVVVIVILRRRNR